MANRRSFSYVLVVVLALVAVGALVGWTWARRSAGAAALRQELWTETGLPRDLADRAGELRELRLPAGVNRLDWLGAELQHLEIGGLGPDARISMPQHLRSLGSLGEVAAVHLDRLPAGMVALRVPNSRLRSWPALPHGIVEVQVAGIEGLGELPGSVRRLIAHGVRIDDLWRLPPVDTLVLSGREVRSIEGMPPSVRSLTLRHTALRSLEQLPDTLERLTLVRNADLDPLDPTRLPSGLVSLTLEDQTVVAAEGLEREGDEASCGAWPCHLRALHLRRVQPEQRGQAIPAPPAGLSELEADAWILPDLAALPPHLETLHLHSWEGVGLGALPESVRSLTLEGKAGALLETLSAPVEILSVIGLTGPTLADLSAVPASVIELDLSGSEVGRLEPLPERLKALTFRQYPLAKLPQHLGVDGVGLPATLERLDLSSSKQLTSLEGLAGLPLLKELRIRGTQVGSTAGLPPSLEVLDLTATPISRLTALPPGLEELHFGQFQLEGLDGLPESVRRLVIEDQAVPLRHASNP